jgi:hypothetical protein
MKVGKKRFVPDDDDDEEEYEDDVENEDEDEYHDRKRDEYFERERKKRQKKLNYMEQMTEYAQDFIQIIERAGYNADVDQDQDIFVDVNNWTQGNKDFDEICITPLRKWEFDGEWKAEDNNTTETFKTYIGPLDEKMAYMIIQYLNNVLHESVNFERGQDPLDAMNIGIYRIREFETSLLATEWVFHHLLKILKKEKIPKNIIKSKTYQISEPYLTQIFNYVKEYIQINEKARYFNDTLTLNWEYLHDKLKEMGFED